MLLDSVVKVISPQGRADAVRAADPAAIRVSRGGNFRIGLLRHRFVLCLHVARSRPSSLQTSGNVVNSIELQLDDIYQAPEVAQAAEKIVGPKLVRQHLDGAVPADPGRAEYGAKS